MSDQERAEIQKNVDAIAQSAGDIVGGSTDPYAKLLVQLLCDINRIADAATKIADNKGPDAKP